MKLETAKSFLLFVLIGVSLLLTFGLWTYQPNYEQLRDAPLLNEIDIGGDEENKKDILEPSSIIFHSNELHFGFEDPRDRQSLFQDMQSWVLYNFETVEADRIPSYYEVEIIFPDALPMEIVNSLFTFNEEVEELPNWSFDRMYFSLNQETASLDVQFLSIDGGRQATAVINDSANYDQLWSTLSSQNGLAKYALFEESGSNIYIPKDTSNLLKRSLPVNNIDSSLLVNALFPTPSVVSQSISPNINLGEAYYTDGVRELRVEQDGRSISFFNPISEDFPRESAVDLLDRSILNINDHNGWTEEYNLMDIDTTLNKVRYQMHYEGYPVFNSSGLSVIVQEWRNQQLYRYNRPLFRLNSSVGSESVDLLSGDEVISRLRNRLSPDYNLENIQDIKLGYDLSYQGNDYITLEPAWFMNYNGAWRKIKFEELLPFKGGD